MHGHVRSQELPIYGTKGIAVREGNLELHGVYLYLTILNYMLSVLFNIPLEIVNISPKSDPQYL